jgi:hypothetical protein
MNSVWAKIPQGCVKFNVDDLVRLTKEKVMFAKWYEQIFSTDIFRAVKVIQRVPNMFMNSHTSYRKPVLQLRAC